MKGGDKGHTVRRVKIGEQRKSGGWRRWGHCKEGGDGGHSVRRVETVGTL